MLTHLRYYNDIHPTLPFLSHNKSRLNTRLNSCPPILRDALLEALYTTVRSFSSSNMSSYQEPQSSRKAASMIAAAQFDNPSARSMSNNLIYLQAMILMAIEADHHGPLAMRSHSGPSQAVWLGSAIGLAYSMKLHVPKQMEIASDVDSDSDEKLARRCWLVLVTLDKFHASSTSSPGLIPDASVVILADDQQFGDSTFHLASKSTSLIADIHDYFANFHRAVLDPRSSGYNICSTIRSHGSYFRCCAYCGLSSERRAGTFQRISPKLGHTHVSASRPFCFLAHSLAHQARNSVF
jgi:hypothetical protein